MKVFTEERKKEKKRYPKQVTGDASMLNGFYALYYTGRTGSGFAVLVLKDGIITGADAGGGTYDGEYTIYQDRGNLEGTIKITTPPGVSLVTGAPPSQQSFIQHFPISLPLDLSQGQPLLVQTSTGPVNLNLKKIRDL
jgi:hypothetical protein